VKILITGAGGQLGTELSRVLAHHQLVEFDHHTLDIGVRPGVMAAIARTRPDVVVHTAALTNVDACETDPAEAWRINAGGTRWVAEAAHRLGAHLVYISTDYVFDGTNPVAYVEWDRTNPLSVYGRTKAAGEIEAGPHATVVRTSWVAGAGPNNIVATVLRLAADPDRPLAFVTDQIGRPTFAVDLARTVGELALDRAQGVYHVTNQGPVVSWYEYAQAILQAGGHDRDRVKPITTAELDPPRPAPRPANSVLDNLALRLAGFPPLPDHRESLQRLIETRAKSG